MKILRLVLLTFGFARFLSCTEFLNEVQSNENLNSSLEKKSAVNQDELVCVFKYYETKVRDGNDLCDIEKQYISARFPQVKASIEHFCGKHFSDFQIPSIAILGSGGGNRAMLSFLGFLLGLQRIGALDTAMYMGGLSGSTWTIAAWLAHGISLSSLKLFLQKQLNTELKLKEFNWHEIFKVIDQKKEIGQKTTLNDIWGGMLADVLFEGLGGSGQQIHFSDLIDRLAKASYPFPIFPAVLDATSPHYEWVEFSPYEMGSEYFGKWIPTTAFGRKFKKGVTVDNPPFEQTLGYMIGLFGSAYAANLNDIGRVLIQKIETYFSKTRSIFDISEIWNETLGGFQISPPTVFNFVREMDCHLSKEKYLSLIDAGCACNLPFPPFLRRRIDLYFVCDASDDVSSEKFNELRRVEKYAAKKKYKFPKIDYKLLEKNKVSIFYDEHDPEVPVIVYVPNKIHFSTFKFEYSPSESAKLFNYMEKVISESAGTILEGVKIAVDNADKRYSKNLKPKPH